MKGTL